MTTSSYFFGTVVTPKQHNALDGLLRPFDWTTWISLVVCTILLMTFQRIQNNMKSSKWFIRPIQLSYLLLSQCNFYLKCVHLNFKLLSTIPVWYFMSMILTSMYQGELYGYLSTTSIPLAPQTVQDIVAFGFPVVTTSKVLVIKREDNKFVSHFAVTELLESLLATESKVGVSNDRRALSRLRESIITHEEPTTHGSNSISVLNFFSQIMNSDSNKYSSNIVYVDLDKYVLRFTKLVQLFTGNVVISGNPIEMFDERVIWVTPRNYFFRLIYPFYQRLHDSGIFCAWERYYENRKLYNFLVISSGKLKWNSTRIQKRWRNNILAFLLSAPQVQAASNSSFQPMALQFFLTFAPVFGYCFFFSIVSFGLELVLWMQKLKFLKTKISRVFNLAIGYFRNIESRIILLKDSFKVFLARLFVSIWKK